MNME
jgi:hypothetical protein